MRFLLIGSGFLSSSISDFLEASDHSVESVSKKNFSLSTINELIGECDFVIYFLNGLNYDSSFEDYMNFTNEDFVRLKCIASHCCALQKKFTFLSSGGGIYKFSSQDPSNEGSPLDICNYYSLYKILAEKFLHFLFASQPELLLILRPTNPFGGKYNKSGILATALRALSTDSTLKIYSPLDAKKNYIYVDDFCEIVSKLVSSDDCFGLFNVGSDSHYSISDLLSVIHRATGEFVRYNPVKVNGHVQHSNNIDIDKLRRRVGRFQFTSLEDGIFMLCSEVNK